MTLAEQEVLLVGILQEASQTKFSLCELSSAMSDVSCHDLECPYLHHLGPFNCEEVSCLKGNRD